MNNEGYRSSISATKNLIILDLILDKLSSWVLWNDDVDPDALPCPESYCDALKALRAY